MTDVDQPSPRPDFPDDGVQPTFGRTRLHTFRGSISSKNVVRDSGAAEATPCSYQFSLKGRASISNDHAERGCSVR